MIGNDIVDLANAAVESNWKRKGYLQKIFNESERFLIHASNDANIMVWLLWTMKEAVYKAAEPGEYGERETTVKTFAPCSFYCNNLILHDNWALGTVVYKGGVFFCKSSLTLDYIHTIAAESQMTLSLVSTKIEDYNIADQTYKASKPASVSHHGRFLALIRLLDSLQSIN